MSDRHDDIEQSMDSDKEMENTPDEQKPRRGPETHDFVLGVLIDSLVEVGAEFRVSLLVDGTFVTGTPISSRDFFSALGREFDRGWAGQKSSPTTWESVFSDLGDQISEKRDVVRQAGWLHLKAVTIVAADGNRYRSSLWRGLLSHVGGWSFGGPDLE